MCKNFYQKLNALSRVSTFLNKVKKMIIFIVTIKPQFFSCQSKYMIKKAHEKSLRLIINDDNNSFETLLQNDKEITVNQRNL